MAQPRGEQAVQSATASIRSTTPSVRVVEMTRVIHSIVEQARKTPAAYVRLWNVPGGAE